jgi:hypothetical protein
MNAMTPIVAADMATIEPLAANNARLAQHEVNELWDLMRDTRTGEGRFLAVMCPGLRSVLQAPASDFLRLRNALLAKLRTEGTV